MAEPTYRPFTTIAGLRGGFPAAETLTGSRTLTLDDLDPKRSAGGQFLRLDPGGAGRAVTLPTSITKSHDGLFVLIANVADNTEDLTVNTSLATISQNEAALFYVTPAGAWALFRIFSTAT